MVRDFEKFREALHTLCDVVDWFKYFLFSVKSCTNCRCGPTCQCTPEKCGDCCKENGCCVEQCKSKLLIL